MRRLDQSTVEADVSCAEFGIRELDASLLVARGIGTAESAAWIVR